MIKSIKKRIVRILDLIYLSVSDCDGMCNHCNTNQQKVCMRRKGLINQ